MLLAAGCSGAGPSDPTRDWTERKLYLEAKAALDDGDYELAIDYYGKLDARFPFGSYTEQGRLELIYAYYKYKEPDSALEEANRFIESHPNHPNVAYAYYLRGLVNHKRRYTWWDRLVNVDRAERDTTHSVRAFADFKALTERFPETGYAVDARERMASLREEIGRHELVVAEFYLGRGAWVAAAARAEYVVKNFPSSSSVPRALSVMALAYRALGLDGLAEDALRVRRANFPGYAEPAPAGAAAGG